jgi:hypothetical protein
MEWQDINGEAFRGRVVELEPCSSTHHRHLDPDRAAGRAGHRRRWAGSASRLIGSLATWTGKRAVAE